MRFMPHVLLAFFLVFFCSQAEAQAQTGRFVVCDGHKMWAVDGAEAIRLGECSGAVWVSPLQLLEPTEEGGEDSYELTPKAKDALRLLQGISKESFKPVRLKQTEVEQVTKDKSIGEDIILSPKLFPSHVRAFFERAESEPPSMVFIISSGAIFVDLNDQFKRYEEVSRYTVRVRGSNPTIGEILEEAKRKPLSKYLEHIKPHLYLMQPETQEALDVGKTAADYHLKHGSVLWRRSSMR